MKIIEKFSVCTILLPAALMCLFDTAWAQNTTLTATPSQITFNTQNGVTPAAQNVLVSSSVSPVSLSVSAYSSTNWLKVTPGSGPSPLTLSVSVGSGAPTSGTDVGFVTVTGPGSSSVTIPVTLNANSSAPSSLSAIPNSLSFNFSAGNTVPATQTVTVSSNTAGLTNYTATPIMNGGGSWLSVFPTSGTLPGSFQVTVNPGALSGSGVFNGAIAINAPGTTGINVPVLVTLAGTPALNVSPAQLNFAFQIGQAAPATQTLGLTSSTGANVSFTATAKTTTCGNNWLVVTPTQGATPATLTVQINTSGIQAGPCTGEIDISAPGASNPSVVVNVNLLASTNPLLLVPTTGPTFNFQIGGAVPAAQNVQITSSSTALGFNVTATPVNNGPNFLQFTPGTGTTPQALSLGINAGVVSSLGPGTYTENVSLTAAGAGNSPQTFPVTLVVGSNAMLTTAVPSLNFNYQVGQATPQSQTFTLTSTGTPLNFQVATSTSNCSGFLSASPATGNTFGNQNQVVVSVNTTGLNTAQVCNGTITLSVPGSTAAPLVIPVTMNVSTTALLNVSQSVITVNALSGSGAVQQTVSVTSTDPGAQLPFTATAATNPPGLTWLSVTPNSGNTPNNLQITINPANLGVGMYTGTITVSSTAPNVPAQTIYITLNVVSSNASFAPPNGVSFNQTLGGPAPASQTVQIAGVPTGATIGVIPTTLNGSGWLTATAAGNTVSVSTNGTQLPQGSYAGVVTVIVPGAGNSPLYVPVTLTVGAAPTLSLSSNTVNLSAQLGTNISGSQTVQVTSTGGNIPFTASFVPGTGGAFVTVTPASGNTPGALTIALNPAVISTLTAGNYKGTVNVSSPNIAGGSQQITVNLAVSAATTPVINSINNAASLQPTNSVAPGEIVSIFGNNLGPITPANLTLTSNGMVSTNLGGVSVLFNSVPAPLTYVSATQINAIVPYEMGSVTTATVTVQFGGATSAMFSVQIVPTAPAIFSLSQGGSGQGAILNQNGTVNGDTNPAPKGSIIQIYGTGEGQIVPAGTTGCVTPGTAPFAKPVAQPITLTIGGQPATISYAGEAPTLVCGAIQINASVPTNISSGPQPIVLTVGNATNSQQNITVAVQ
ncbi:MAG TPA: IPT/TIG domain-containing protein [Bryobacteraceae bacterium]|nr:IPT/TIG domain-containing protein [Bryobacteraceae bacterium]